MAMEDKLIDKRVLARSLRKGLVENKQYQAHLSALPDVADNIDTSTGEADGESPPSED